MSTLLQPGQHPDADQLSAFVEQALPPHEQQQTLAHLATCPDCRALVYLAQQAVPIESPQPQTDAARRSWLPGWLTGWGLAIPAAALACLVLLTIHLRRATTGSSQTTLPATTASNNRAARPIAVAPEETAVVPISPGAPSNRTPSRTKRQHVATDRTANGAMKTLALPAATTPAALEAPLAQMSAISEANVATPGSGGVQGRIVDPSGAAVPDAQVIATNTDTGVQLTHKSDRAGIYSLAPLQPGKYNFEIVAPGFQRQLQENVMVAGNSVARLDPTLTIGSANETVAVTDAPPRLDTADATLGGTIENELYSQLPLSMNGGPRDPKAFQYLAPGAQEAPAVTTATPAASANSGIVGGTGQTNLSENYLAAVPPVVPPPPAAESAAANALAASPVSGGGIGATLLQQPPTLPSKLPSRSIVQSASLRIAIDTAGALFRSDDAGATWHGVTTQWEGRALSLRLVQPRSAAAQAAANNTVNASKAGKPAQILAPLALAFELTTDSGAIYTSPEGQTWQRK